MPGYLQAYPDNTKHDSLNTALQKPHDNTSRLEIYNSYYEYWKYKNNDSSLYYAYKALSYLKNSNGIIKPTLLNKMHI